eukprot:2454843-Amphidinium_carterae.1
MDVQRPQAEGACIGRSCHCQFYHMLTVRVSSNVAGSSTDEYSQDVDLWTHERWHDKESVIGQSPGRDASEMKSAVVE